MASTISAGTTTTTALVYSADTSGVLQLQTNGGTTALTLDTSQNATFAGKVASASSLQLATNGTTTAVTIDTSGNLLVGNTAQSGTANRVAVFSANKFGLSIIDTTAQATGVGGALNLGGNYRSSGDAQAFARVSAVKQNSTDSDFGYGMAFSVTPNGGTFTEAGRFDSSGNLGVGTASAYSTVNVYVGTATNGGTSQGGVSIQGGSSGSTDTGHASGTSSGTSYERFIYNGSVIGSITQNGTTGVLYNLTSDYRLKNNPEALTGAKDFIMALKPKKWQWWDGSGEGVGFVAHEFMEVAKYSGHGEKDAVDADGKPVYQSIQPSSSEVMANLVSFIQELSAQVTSLQATVETQATTIATLQNKIGA